MSKSFDQTTYYYMEISDSSIMDFVATELTCQGFKYDEDFRDMTRREKWIFKVPMPNDNTIYDNNE